MSTITLYTKPGCQPCRITAKKFSEAGIQYNTIDISQNAETLAYVTQVLGYQQAPVVVTDNGHWSGLDLENINQTIFNHTK
ncbi:glutaredoxin family protein [Acaricomes phytoseiuli]|uniref:glutaredoxin family protein n=1 Tax=Acaricomes phytoseiuli TaxID=291968 RepID=UPI002221648A|nr:glutaredoxin family protein [Acaricomes phytoseiuli]MCW1250550.1 glutaredoxin family protein [Acaricomes phytoseiuli]